jgi:LDH2 family malate/lactate/ureidoglycolate dehydrogenase
MTSAEVGSALIPEEALRGFCGECFRECGLSGEDAELVSHSLVQANLRGIDSHGVTRLGIYVKRLRRGLINPRPDVRVVGESDATLLIHGDNGMGQVVGVRALDLGVSKARKSGAASVGVSNANHYGAGAYYVERAVREDLIASAYSNASPTMAPWGGVDPSIGTNPFSYGIPAGRHSPIIIDMATSVVARGKIILAAREGKPIPEGWALDSDGWPTTDAQKALEGTVLPTGEHKGYALSLLLDIMSGVLTGAGFGQHVNNMYDDMDTPQNVGAFFQLTDIDRFMPVARFKERVDQMVEELKAVRRAPGVEEILVPGEIEDRIRRERLSLGVPLGAEALSELKAAGKVCRVDFEDYVVQVQKGGPG